LIPERAETEGDRKRQHTSRESTVIESKVRTERMKGRRRYGSKYTDTEINRQPERKTASVV
jgi:hypothetical protein